MGSVAKLTLAGVLGLFSAVCAAQDSTLVVSDTVAEYCDEPGMEGITFADFTPCATAPDASVWNITDSRDGKRYKVKKLADGRYWIVQDLRFGNQGFLYDWATAVNMPGANYGDFSYWGCRGTSTIPTGYQPNMCRGICPPGWHLPTIDEFTDAYSAFKRAYHCRGAACWDSGSAWEGVANGYASADGEIFYQDTLGIYWSSTVEDQYAAFGLWFIPHTHKAGETRSAKSSRRAVRCIRNY
jgi:uncharacterized protein (TIGR02145 family)